VILSRPKGQVKEAPGIRDLHKLTNLLNHGAFLRLFLGDQ